MGVYKVQIIETDDNWYCYWKPEDKWRHMEYQYTEGSDWVWRQYWITHPTFGNVELQFWWNMTDNTKSYAKIKSDTLADKIVPAKFEYKYISRL
jgi:hypothetical protein